MRLALLALVTLLAGCVDTWERDPRCPATDCTKYGWCQYLSDSDRCAPLTDADCQQSTICQKLGACYVRSGGGICLSTKPK